MFIGLYYIIIFYRSDKDYYFRPLENDLAEQRKEDCYVDKSRRIRKGYLLIIYFLFQFLDFCFTALFSFRVLKVKFLSIMLMIIACLVLNISTSINV